MKKKMLGLGLIGGVLSSAVFIGGCVPEGTGKEGGSPWTMLVFLALMFAFLYFRVVKQRTRQKQHQQMVEELKRGDRVITAGGIYGQIESLSDDSVIIKVESGATMRVARNSVALRREK